jgi:hypothetical protein
MLPITRRKTRVTGGELGAVMGYRARRKWRVAAAGAAGLACAIALAGCGPVPTVTVVDSDGAAFEGGSCGIVVNVTNATANTMYEIGMFTTGPTIELGELTTNSSGSINDGRVDYPSDKESPRQYSNLYVSISTVQGAGLAADQVGVAVCLPTGLAA